MRSLRSAGLLRPCAAKCAFLSKRWRPCVKCETSASMSMLAGPVSKANTCCGLQARKNRNVGYAPEIQRDAAEFLVAVKKIVHIRDERCALATESHIRRTKIAYGCDARARGDHRWLANLKRRCRWRTEIRNGAPLMKDGLAMAPNERNSFSRNLELAARGQGGVSE